MNQDRSKRRGDRQRPAGPAAKPNAGGPRQSAGGPRRRAKRTGHARGAGGDSYWIYGRHPALAALANPARKIERVVATPTFLDSHGEALEKVAAGAAWSVEEADSSRFDQLLGADVVHQGLAAAARPLEQPDVAELLAPNDDAVVVVLDQASDPRNVGAVIRASAAFGALAVVTTLRSAPPETGSLAKAAAGALESIAYVQATNLARAIDMLKENGFWAVGLDGAATLALADAPFDRPTALVMGAEDKGLRRLTAERCDVLARIPIAPGIESLNVATAAAIALYERRRR